MKTNTKPVDEGKKLAWHYQIFQAIPEVGGIALEDHMKKRGFRQHMPDRHFCYIHSDCACLTGEFDLIIEQFFAQANALTTSNIVKLGIKLVRLS